MLNREKPLLLLSGFWRHAIYEEALEDGFRQSGWDVIRHRVRHASSTSTKRDRVQQWVRLGPWISKINHEILKAVATTNPDAVFFHRPFLFNRRTIIQLRRNHPDVLLVAYDNDNPYCDPLRWLRWRHYLGALPHFHLVIGYRPGDLIRMQHHGAKYSRLLRPYFIQGFHDAQPDASPDKSIDVTFIGHYEPDGRERAIETLISKGVRVAVHGTGWDKMPSRYRELHKQTIEPKTGDDYIRALRSARIALGLCSRRNEDVYTRRCFEIPATGTLLLAPYSNELAKLYIEDEEAVFFRSQDEIVSKCMTLLSNEEEVKRIANNGQIRCIHSGYDHISTVAPISQTMKRLLFNHTP